MDPKILASAIAAVLPDLADHRVAVEDHVAESRKAATAIVVAGVGGRVTDESVKLGPEAVAQARAYLDGSDDEHVLDGLSHLVFNRLRDKVTAPAVPVVVAMSKLDLLNAVPDLFDAEVAWRTAAAADIGMATALGYWDRAVAINPVDPLPAKILDALVAAHICSAELRTRLVDACTVQRSPTPASALEDPGVNDATLDDVRAILGGGA